MELKQVQIQFKQNKGVDTDPIKALEKGYQ